MRKFYAFHYYGDNACVWDTNYEEEGIEGYNFKGHLAVFLTQREQKAWVALYPKPEPKACTHFKGKPLPPSNYREIVKAADVRQLFGKFGADTLKRHIADRLDTPVEEGQLAPPPCGWRDNRHGNPIEQPEVPLSPGLALAKKMGLI